MILALSLVLPLLCGCAPKKYTRDFLAFDTVFTITAYSRTQREFNEFADECERQFHRLHELFDIFNDYNGVNNLKTVNDNAGISPVAVDGVVLDLVDFAIEWCGKTDGAVNIALDPVTALWRGEQTPSEAEIEKAQPLCDIGKVEVDRENGTLFLMEKGMSLDVGAVAKGFAVQYVGSQYENAPPFLINAGGNVLAHGAPSDGRDTWSVGIQNPYGSGNAQIIKISDMSAATSGNYRRGKHIIDPYTLRPAERFASVTAIVPDAGIADILSTTLFIISREEGETLMERLGYDAVWIE